MPLKFWHQSTTEMTRDSPYGQALIRRAHEVLGDSVVLDPFGLPAGTYRGRGVSSANGNAFVYHRILDQMIDKALQAEREGYDAFIIGSYSEPFLKETRAAVVPRQSRWECAVSPRGWARSGASRGRVPRGGLSGEPPAPLPTAPTHNHAPAGRLLSSPRAARGPHRYRRCAQHGGAPDARSQRPQRRCFGTGSPSDASMKCRPLDAGCMD